MSKPNKSRVDEIIVKYESEPNLGLIPLMDLRRELSCQYYAYQKLAAEAESDYRQYRVQRKSIEAKGKNHLVAQGKSVAAATAEIEAREDYREAYEKEYTAEGRKEAGKRLADAIKQVLSSMQQEIADLRHEKNETMRGHPASTA